MDWITGIQRAIDYVEEHLDQEIDYAQVARQAYSSSFHFQRVFTVICGFTLGEYIRNRRLSQAGAELAGGGRKVIDVALKYGYDAPESFSRAFTRFHGVSPSQVKHGASLKSFSRLRVKLTLQGGNTMEYRLETSAAFDVLVRKQTFPRQQEITSSQVPQFWAQCHRDGTIPALCQYISADGIFSGSIIGVCFGWNGEQTDFPYGIGVPYHGQGITDPRLHIEHIPAQTYLVFPVVGKMPDAFHTLYTKLYTEFFPASEYFPCGAEIEVYPSADTDAPDFECELWIAVEKKK